MKDTYWSKEELSSFCLEFSMLLKAGMSVGESFSILSENESDAKKKEMLFSLYEKTIVGGSVSEAMVEAKVFPSYMLNMLEIGEETGHLEEIFGSLSRYYEERIRTIKLLKETVAFPIVLFFMMLAVVVLLITQVLPVFQGVFAQLGGTLPTIAIFFLNLGGALRSGKYIFLGILAVLVVLGLCILFVPVMKERCNRFLSKSFARTKIGKISAMAHFASALSMTVSGGLDTDRALEMTEKFCDDSVLLPEINKCRAKMQEGMGFAEAIETERLLKPMYCRMLAIGVKTGNLDTSLDEVARRSEEESSAALTKAAATVEPVVVIALSVVVGVLLLSVMFPLVGIMSSLG